MNKKDIIKDNIYNFIESYRQFLIDDGSWTEEEIEDMQTNELELLFEKAIKSGIKLGEEKAKIILNKEIIKLLEIHHKEWHGECTKEDYECDYKSLIKELQRQKGDSA